jgi:hypothetical protein
MPIRKSQKPLYPPNWKEISIRIRFDRANGRCECRGDCGGHKEYPRDLPWIRPDGRCEAHNGDHIKQRDSSGNISWSNRRVVLTVAHLNHNPSDVRDENLLALCQACHLSMDRHHHACTRAENRDAAKGQADMFGYEEARREGATKRICRVGVRGA